MRMRACVYYIMKERIYDNVSFAYNNIVDAEQFLLLMLC